MQNSTIQYSAYKKTQLEIHLSIEREANLAQDISNSATGPHLSSIAGSIASVGYSVVGGIGGGASINGSKLSVVEGGLLALVSTEVGISGNQVHALDVLLRDSLVSVLMASEDGGGGRASQAVVVVDLSRNIRDRALAVGELGSSIGDGGSREVTGPLDGAGCCLEAVCGLVSW